MELEPISSCCSSSPSPSVPSSSYSGEDAAANMTELEAAEALADLAQLAIMREQVFESASSWGSKGKRVRKRVKTESPPCDSCLKPPDLEALPTPDLAEERAVKAEVQPINRELTKVQVKTELDAETPKPDVASTIKCRSNGCGRSRQNLSEAEREERRIRRILANRESARQTIRRRQAMCEELSKKAADLTYENENLRREKDWALKEFQSLETVNKHLKEQVSNSVKPDTKGPEESPKPSQVEMSASTTPFYFYNQNPYQLFCWSPVAQSSNLMMLPLETRNGFKAPFITSGGASAKTMTSQENHLPDDNGQKTHFFVVPGPWFLPRPNEGTGVSFGFQDSQRGISSNGHSIDNSSANPIEVRETLPSHLPTRSKEEDSGSNEARPLYDLNESATEVLSEGGSFPVKQQAYSLKHEDVSESTNEVTQMSPGHHVLISLPKKKQGSVAAAEARKRRKELTKLKNLHGRQCRMQV